MSALIKKVSDKEININSPLWETLEPISIACVNWDKPEKEVKSFGKLCHNDEGIYVKLSSDEKELIVLHKQHCSDVYKDSTVEFFIHPNKNDTNHFNFEINAEGYALIGFGTGRNRIRFSEEELDFSRFKITNKITDDGFEIMLFVPYDFLLEHTSKISETVRCNIFKCCEKEGHKHYYSAFPIKSEVPNFHVLEAFSEFILD